MKNFKYFYLNLTSFLLLKKMRKYKLNKGTYKLK